MDFTLEIIYFDNVNCQPNLEIIYIHKFLIYNTLAVLTLLGDGGVFCTRIAGPAHFDSFGVKI